MSMMQDLQNATDSWEKLTRSRGGEGPRKRLALVIELMTMELEEQAKIRFEEHYQLIKDRIDSEKVQSNGHGG